MTCNIHPTAIVHDEAKLGDSVEIGPFCIVEKDVTLDDNVRLVSHVTIAGHTKIGARTIVYPFSSLGHAPQDLKFSGEVSYLEIGADCTIREHVTMNPGTESGGFYTRVGNHCLIMVGVHVAHDCQIGNHVIMVNNSTLAGHCHIGDYVIMGGLSAAHQFVRIGEHAFIGGMSGVENDVIPFGSVIGNRAHLAGLNLVGLKRHQYEREEIHNLRHAFKMLFDSSQGTIAEQLTKIRNDYSQSDLVMRMVQFIESGEDRALCTPSKKND